MSNQPAAAPRPAEPFVVGEWTVHPDRNLLLRDGDERRLDVRTMDVLVHLAARAGEVVTKDDLIDAVWEGRIIAEGTLTNAVAELRAALGDDARRPLYIETIPKRGYRLLAAVDHVAAAEEETAPGARGWSRRRIAAITVAAVVAVAAVAGVVLRASVQRLDPERVLVVPPANRSDDPASDQVALMARDLMVQVAMDAGLGPMVAGAEPAATQDEAVRMGREVRAGVVVVGSIYLRDGELEVQTQLVDTAAGELLYAVPPVVVGDGASTTALAELSDRTLGAVATHLRAHAYARLLSHVPPLAAYREFMAGSEHFGSDYEKAFLHLRRAVEIDPAYTSAWIRLAVGYSNTGRYPEADTIFARLEARRQQLTPVERLSLDYFAERETAPETSYAAIRELARMVPHDPVLNFQGGQQALRINRPHEALQWVGVAPRPIPPWIARTPVGPGLHWVRATALHMLGDHAAALTAAREGVRRYPGVLALRLAEATAVASLGDRRELEGTIAAGLAAQLPQGGAGWLILQGAAAARAHEHPALADELSTRAAVWFDKVDDRGGGIPFGLAEALFYVGGAELARARRILEGAIDSLPDENGFIPLAARGWLGALAARQGDVKRASELDGWLAAVSDPRLHDDALFYRAGIAAWRGDCEAAAGRFREALAAGWGNFDALHDRERILLEPVAGDPYFVGVLNPER